MSSCTSIETSTPGWTAVDVTAQPPARHLRSVRNARGFELRWWTWHWSVERKRSTGYACKPDNNATIDDISTRIAVSRAQIRQARAYTQAFIDGRVVVWFAGVPGAAFA